MTDKKQQLMEMGFDAAKAQEALTACNDNVERAIEYLFGGGGGGGPTDAPSGGGTSSAAASLANAQDVVASISQYTMDEGRSACTCIALTAAQEFLQSPAASTATPQFLENAIREGVTTYENLRTLSSSVEHMSAEEVLKLSAGSNGSFSKLQLTAGGIRQGLLSHDTSNPMGLQTLLEACRQEGPSDQWMAVLITKTPETVLAVLPPPNSTGEHMVIDSHPRPQVVGGNGAYARILTSLDQVVAHLSTILPATELGPDIPEMMAMMYNSFDLYPFVKK